MKLRLILPLATLLSFAAPGPPAAIVLAIPELGVTMEGDTAQAIPSEKFDQFEIHIPSNAGQSGYGTIHTKINTESADNVMETRGTENGVLCIFDLKLRGGQFHLHPGRNSVEVFFSDRLARVHYASFLLDAGERAKSGSRAAVPTIKARPEHAAGEKYAVIVGISRYEHHEYGLGDLKFAAADARAVRDFLLSGQGGGFKKENIRYLTDQEATHQNLRSALFTFLAQAQPGDEVILYLAGHGAPDPNDPRFLYFLTSDAKVDDMGGTAFPMEEAPEVFSHVKAGRVVVFADTCHSYGFSGARNALGKSNNLFNQYLAEDSKKSKFAVMTASDISELSMESDEWGGHGVFTYYVLEGLRGKADLNHDGTVTAGELFAYVRQQVATATHGNQNPQALPGLSEALALSSLSARSSAGGLSLSPLESWSLDSAALTADLLAAGLQAVRR